MPRQRRVRRAPTVLAGATLTVALAAGQAGCSRDEPAPPAPNPPSTAPTTSGKAPIVVNAVEPARRLLPADIGDDYGRRIGSLIYRGLLRYDAKGRLVNEVAADVTAESPVLYRVKLRQDREDWAFSNGESVTAASFVDAWSFAANPSCGQLHADAFAPIAGYRSMRGLPEPTPAPPAAGSSGSGTGPSTAGATTTTPTASAPTAGTPTAPTPTAGAAPSAGGPQAAVAACTPQARVRLAGLTVVNDREFTVRLAQPDATFRDRLATLPYAPLPRSTLADPASASTAPVGNGPYQLAGGWFEGKEVRLIPNASYPGGAPAHNGGLTFRFFPDPSLSYAALLGGRLEVLDDTPITALDRYKADLGFRALNQPIGAASTLVFPIHRPEWAGAPGLALRKAISRAIDRKALADGLFAGTRTPATDLAAPGVVGYVPDVCGDTCRHDPQAAAKALPAKPPVTALEIAYAPEAGGRPAVEALCTAVTSALRISCVPRPVPRDPATGASLDILAARHELTIPMLATYRMTRPDLGGFLSPRFVAGSSDNPSGYAGPAAQALLAKAAVTEDVDARMALYRDAEKAILADLPEIPLWYLNATTAGAPGMQPVRIDVVGVPLYAELNRT